MSSQNHVELSVISIPQTHVYAHSCPLSFLLLTSNLQYDFLLITLHYLTLAIVSYIILPWFFSYLPITPSQSSLQNLPDFPSLNTILSSLSDESAHTNDLPHIFVLVAPELRSLASTCPLSLHGMLSGYFNIMKSKTQLLHSVTDTLPLWVFNTARITLKPSVS